MVPGWFAVFNHVWDLHTLVNFNNGRYYAIRGLINVAKSLIIKNIYLILDEWMADVIQDDQLRLIYLEMVYVMISDSDAYLRYWTHFLGHCYIGIYTLHCLSKMLKFLCNLSLCKPFNKHKQLSKMKKPEEPSMTEHTSTQSRSALEGTIIIAYIVKCSLANSGISNSLYDIYDIS